MAKEGKITIQINTRGELIYVDFNGRKFTKRTHNLDDKTPPGVLKGIMDVGKIYCYEKPDGTRAYCHHIGVCRIV
jgi:hypothetical protein